MHANDNDATPYVQLDRPYALNNLHKYCENYMQSGRDFRPNLYGPYMLSIW